MAEITEIAWTDCTFNPWEGCEKVGPGCDFCYAEARDQRFTGGLLWGPDAQRRVMADSNWSKPKKWNRRASENRIPLKVFCGSICDWADKKAPDGQRERLWGLVRETPMLRWQLLTKRAPNIKRFLPDDWGDGYDNVWLGVTVENRKHGLARIDHLRQIPAKVRFLSVEPLIEDLGEINLAGIHWVIVGGESGPFARPLDVAWVARVRSQCEEQGIPFFFKQWGGRRNKAGCLLNGVEVKQWPAVV